MTLEPLLNASPIIQIHAFGAMAGFVLGLIQFAAPKGTLPHKTLGLVWIVIMAAVAISSAFIYPPPKPGDPFWARFTPIHIFTVLTVVGLARGVSILLRGGPRMRFHGQPFMSIFIGGLIIAGILSFLPGRIMHQVAFGG